MSYTSIKGSTFSVIAMAAAVAAALCAVCFLPTSAWGVTSAELQAEAQSALASMNALQTQLEEAVNASALAEEEAQKAEEACVEAKGKIQTLNEELANIQSNLSTRAHGMYRQGQSSILDCLLGATTFQEFITQWDLLSKLNHEDMKSVKKAKEVRAELEEQKRILDEQKILADQKAADAKAAEEEIVASFVEMKNLYDSLSAEVQTVMSQEFAAQQSAQMQVQAQQQQPMVQGVDYAYSSTDSSTGATTYYDASGNVILQRAYDMIGGAMYSYGACSEGYLDCSGFVSYCLTGNYSRIGSTHTFMQWNQVEATPGCVVTNDSHCGIYIGNDKMIDCSTWGDTSVMIRDVEPDMIYVQQ